MESNQVINANCWVAYFDILGFKNRIHDFNKQFGYGHLDTFVKIDYHDILNEAKNRVEQHKELLDKIEYTWFSDSFLFYIPVDDNGYSFSVFQSLAWQFLRGCIWKRIPLAGAMSAGEFYANKKENVFIGPALIDAVEYSEKQNWIGLVITPTGFKELQKFELNPLNVFEFREYGVPVKIKVKNDKDETVIKESIERLIVFKMNKHHKVENRIREMHQKADKEAKIKYENTLKSIDNK